MIASQTPLWEAAINPKRVLALAAGRFYAIGEFTDLQLNVFGWRLRFTASMRRLRTVRTRIIRVGFCRLPLHGLL